jgi:hypothetical protein
MQFVDSTKEGYFFKALSPSNGSMGSPSLMITSSVWRFDLSTQDDELLPFFDIRPHK